MGFTESLKEIGYQGVRRGDLVIHAMDAFAGACGVADSDGKSTPVYSVCAPKDERANSHYYAFCVREMARSRWILALSRGVRERSTDFRFTAFGNELVPLPPSREQLAIVRFLEHADRRIKRYIFAKEKLIQLLEEQRQAIVHRAVTGQIDVRTGQPYPAYKDPGVEWLAEVPEHWEVRTFTRNCVEISDYRGATPRKTNSGVFLVTAKNLQRGWIDYDASREFVAEREYKNIMRRGLPGVGDLLITTEAPLGLAALVDREDIALAQRVIRFRLDESVLMPGFGLHSILDRYFQNQLKRRGTGSTALGIKASKLPQLKIVCPPINEQRAISEHLQMALHDTERRSAAAGRLIVLLEEYRARLSADVVTGKLDVREAAASLPEIDSLEGSRGRHQCDVNTSLGPQAADPALEAFHR